VGDRLEVDLGALTSLAWGARQSAEELRAVLRQLGGIEATIAAGGPQARPAQENVASAKKRIGDTARALDGMHVDIRKRAALLEEHEQPNGLGGLLDLLERDAEGLLDGGRTCGTNSREKSRSSKARALRSRRSRACTRPDSSCSSCGGLSTSMAG